MQWSRSEIVRSDAEGSGEVNEESERYLYEWPEINSPDVGSVTVGVALVDGVLEEIVDVTGGEAAGLAAFRLNANFPLGALAVRVPSKSDSINLIFCRRPYWLVLRRLRTKY